MLLWSILAWQVRLLEYGIATWRVSRMLVKEAGPGQMFVGFRERTGIEYDRDGNLSSYPDWNPLHCVYCTSIYVAVAMLLAPRWLVRACAVSGWASLIEQFLRNEVAE